MRYLSSGLLILLLILFIHGCSSGGFKNPVEPLTDETSVSNQEGNPDQPVSPSMQDIASAEYSLLAEGSAQGDPTTILYTGILELDRENGTITHSLDRETMYNYNITSLLMGGGNFRYTINSIVDEIWDIDVTIENPTSLLPFDIRLIFLQLLNKTVENPDGYTDLFDPPGGIPFNPFIAFAKDEFLRAFPPGPGSTDTQKLLLKWPAGDPPVIQYIVTASYPMNTEEPYVIEDFVQIGEFWWEGGECNLAVRVDDWQWDISAVRADTTVFNNEIVYLVSSPEQPDIYEVHIININNALPGIYPTLFKAESPNPQNASIYNIFDVIVTGPPQTAPVCDFYIDPDFVYVGQTTWLYPGPGITDPDGDSIILYEFDFNYNDGIFNRCSVGV